MDTQQNVVVRSLEIRKRNTKLLKLEKHKYEI